MPPSLEAGNGENEERLPHHKLFRPRGEGRGASAPQVVDPAVTMRRDGKLTQPAVNMRCWGVDVDATNPPVSGIGHKLVCGSPPAYILSRRVGATQKTRRSAVESRHITNSHSAVPSRRRASLASTLRTRNATFYAQRAHRRETFSSKRSMTALVAVQSCSWLAALPNAAGISAARRWISPTIHSGDTPSR